MPLAGQGAGKTTLLRALIASIPHNERFGTLETDYELLTHLQPGLDPEVLRAEAASVGIPTVIWSYPRGEGISKDGETAIDIAAYAAQMAALLGAHVIKIKLSTDHLENKDAKKVYEEQGIDISTQAARVKHCMDAAFAGRRLVVFSGGAAKGADAVYDDARAIRDGGGNGSIIGRNSFQRSREDALDMLGKLVDIYLGRA